MQQIVENTQQSRGGQSASVLSFTVETNLFQALEQRARTIPCQESRRLFSQGEAPSGLFVVRGGEASLVLQAPNGRIVLSLQATRGSVIGLAAVVGNQPYTMSAIARKDSDIGFVKGVDLNRILRETPSLYSAALQILASEIRAAREVIAAF